MVTEKTATSAILAFLAMLMCGAVIADGQAAQHSDHGGADDPHAHHRAMLSQGQALAGSATSVELRNLELIMQNGEPVHFASDVVGDHIVVMDFVYTTCTTICPVISAIFEQVQHRLGDRLDADVRIISVSVDPGRDTPERLQSYADRHHAGPGWIWLTGEKPVVDEVLRGLGAYTPDFEDHPSIVLVGDPQSGTWKRFFGFPGPAKILAAVDELSAARQVASVSK